jgi:purine-binding chemotaxis protein CheW
MLTDSSGMSGQLVALRAHGQRWALPLSIVERVVAMVAVSVLPLAPSGVRGAINVHGEIVPVLDLAARFGLPAGERGPDAQLVLARTRRRTVAVEVDEAIGVMAVEPAAIAAGERLPRDLAAAPVAGVAALRDGLLVIHDLDAFLTDAEEERLDRALAEAAP